MPLVAPESEFSCLVPERRKMSVASDRDPTISPDNTSGWAAARPPDLFQPLFYNS
jgi:hypothetical protein